MSIEDTKPAHALWAPSGADRWAVCAGSTAMEADEPGETNEYADEGTAAHHIGAICLRAGDDAARYIGRKIDVVNGVVWEPGTAKAPLLRGHSTDVEHTFEVSDDMARDIQTYLDNVRGYVTDGTYMIEQALPIEHLTGEEGATGTGDFIYLTGDGEEIQAHDLKFGRGVEVKAERNRQLMMYGLGALRKFSDLIDAVYGVAPKRFRAVIHQPRIHDAPDEWSCTLDELFAFAEEIRAAARTATGLYDAGKEYVLDVRPDSLLPGEKQCRWCKAKPTCPALAKFVQDQVGADFDDLDPQKHPDMDPVILIATVDDEELGRKARAYDLIEVWGKAVRARIETRLQASRNDSDVQRALGFKLVPGKKGNRRWRDETAVEAMLKKARIKAEVMYDMSLKTPPALEKLIAKEQPKRWKKLQAEIEQRDGQPHVAPLDDKRKPIVISNPADDFDDGGEPA